MSDQALQAGTRETCPLRVSSGRKYARMTGSHENSNLQPKLKLTPKPISLCDIMHRKTSIQSAMTTAHEKIHKVQERRLVCC
jgi:hypothetical protein